MARNMGKRKARSARQPSDKYDRNSYGLAVDRACDRAFPPAGELARRVKESRAKWWARLTPEQREDVKRWRKAHRWHPNQLRHSFAARVRTAHGLEATRVLLGLARAVVAGDRRSPLQHLAAGDGQGE